MLVDLKIAHKLYMDIQSLKDTDEELYDKISVLIDYCEDPYLSGYLSCVEHYENNGGCSGEDLKRSVLYWIKTLKKTNE